jgi:release factor glutamine methyltransferase
MPAPITIHELLQAARARLPVSGAARFDSEVLLAAVLKRERNYLYAHPEASVTGSEAADFNSLIARRADGYPVAYLTGHREFWSIAFSVDSHTLIPRPETELLIESSLELLGTGDGLKVVDLGTGSGAIAIALASERPLCSITATDVSTRALARAAANTAANGLTGIRFVQSDWFSELGHRRYDLIVSNPPYVESGDPGFLHGEIRHEPRIALDGGIRGMDAYLRIIPAAARYLTGRGWLLLEHGHTQGEAVRQLLRDCRYVDIITRRDYAGHERVTRARLPR